MRQVFLEAVYITWFKDLSYRHFLLAQNVFRFMSSGCAYCPLKKKENDRCLICITWKTVTHTHKQQKTIKNKK